jgi:hypothetical protein
MISLQSLTDKITNIIKIKKYKIKLSIIQNYRSIILEITQETYTLRSYPPTTLSKFSPSLHTWSAVSICEYVHVSELHVSSPRQNATYVSA